MVVNTGLSVGGDNLGVILCRLAIGVLADIQLALAVCVAVVVVELIVDHELDVVVDVPVQAESVGFCSTAIYVAVVEVADLVASAEFEVAPLAAALDLGVLGALCVILVLTSEEKVSCLYVPSAEVLGCRVCCVSLEVDVVAYVCSLVAESVPVAGDFDSPEVVVVESREIVGVKIFPAVEVGRVAGACTICSPFASGEVGSGGPV